MSPEISSLIREKYAGSVSLAAMRGEKTLVITFNNIYNFNEELALLLLKKPEPILSDLETAAQEALLVLNPEYAKAIGRLQIRVRGLLVETRIRKIGSDLMGNLVQIHGIVKSTSIVQPSLTLAYFRCRKCKEGESRLDQVTQFLVYPQDACNSCKARMWDLNPQKSTYVDQQWMTIQEAIDTLPPGQMPRNFRLELRGPLCHSANPGDRVRVTAIVDVLQKTPNTTEKTLELYGRIVDVDILNQEGDVEITEETQRKIIDLSQDPSLDRKMIDSVAPSLYGLRNEKLTLLLQLFGGVAKEVNGSRIRGDIHSLFCGDPGCGKSQLLRFASELSPRGVFTTGRGSSGVGLTASVIKEKDQGYVLEAGALVIADKGVCMIDEIDKMDEDDRGAVHPAMEQQFVTVNKAGINAELNCRCAVSAASNPKSGRWNPYKNILDNIDLPVTLLNRFDVIWIIRDIPNQEVDQQAATHVIDYHSNRAPKPLIDAKFLRQYILYSRHVKPTIPQDVGDRIQEYYLKLRKESNQDDGVTIMITLRQLESIIRLVEAHARMHLRDEATQEDAEVAIDLLDKSMLTVGVDVETGKRDMDVILTGKPKSLRDQMETVLKVIGEVKASALDGIAHQEEVARILNEKYGMDEVKFDKVLKVLLRDGVVYCPRPHFLSLT